MTTKTSWHWSAGCWGVQAARSLSRTEKTKLRHQGRRRTWSTTKTGCFSKPGLISKCRLIYSRNEMTPLS